MQRIALPLFGLVVAALPAFLPGPQPAPPAGPGAETAPRYAPAYTADDKLLMPTNYRQWVFLSSGVDMSYNPKTEGMGHTMFDNVFVNPEAYASFQRTGTWPDKTVLVLEGRMGMEKGSINQKGHYQAGDVMGLEVHIKDESRFPGKWAFYDFDNAVSGELIPKEAACYSCHAQHAAVDTTFVQFYPTLLPIAKAKNTLSASYLKEADPAR